jgi:hypothetical protein
MKVTYPNSSRSVVSANSCSLEFLRTSAAIDTQRQ